MTNFERQFAEMVVVQEKGCEGELPDYDQTSSKITDPSFGVVDSLKGLSDDYDKLCSDSKAFMDATSIHESKALNDDFYRSFFDDENTTKEEKKSEAVDGVNDSHGGDDDDDADFAEETDAARSPTSTAVDSSEGNRLKKLAPPPPDSSAPRSRRRVSIRSTLQQSQEKMPSSLTVCSEESDPAEREVVAPAPPETTEEEIPSISTNKATVMRQLRRRGREAGRLSPNTRKSNTIKIVPVTREPARAASDEYVPSSPRRLQRRRGIKQDFQPQELQLLDDAEESATVYNTTKTSDTAATAETEVEFVDNVDGEEEEGEEKNSSKTFRSPRHIRRLSIANAKNVSVLSAGGTSAPASRRSSTGGLATVRIPDDAAYMDAVASAPGKPSFPRSSSLPHLSTTNYSIYSPENNIDPEVHEYNGEDDYHMSSSQRSKLSRKSGISSKRLSRRCSLGVIPGSEEDETTTGKSRSRSRSCGPTIRRGGRRNKGGDEKEGDATEKDNKSSSKSSKNSRRAPERTRSRSLGPLDTSESRKGGRRRSSLDMSSQSHASTKKETTKEAPTGSMEEPVKKSRKAPARTRSSSWGPERSSSRRASTKNERRKKKDAEKEKEGEGKEKTSKSSGASVKTSRRAPARTRSRSLTASVRSDRRRKERRSSLSSAVQMTELSKVQSEGSHVILSRAHEFISAMNTSTRPQQGQAQSIQEEPKKPANGFLAALYDFVQQPQLVHQESQKLQDPNDLLAAVCGNFLDK